MIFMESTNRHLLKKSNDFGVGDIFIGYMAIRVVEFLRGRGDTKLEKKMPKDQHTQRKPLNFDNWNYGEVSKRIKI